MPGVLRGNSGSHRVWNDLFKDISVPETSNDLDIQRRQLSEIINLTCRARNIEIRENDWQINAAANVILGNDVCVVVPTGEGKSFCYQLIALCCRGHTLLVVTPLVALGKDQVSCKVAYMFNATRLQLVYLIVHEVNCLFLFVFRYAHASA